MPRAEKKQLGDRILDFVQNEGGHPATDEQAFNSLARDLFEYQYSRNTAYRPFCQAAGVSPVTVSSWWDIPPIPANAFKRFDLACFPIRQAVKIFHTSGTTLNETGKHYLDTLRLYEAAILPNFKRALLPDRNQIRMAFLTPSPEDAPHSSLIHMADTVAMNFGIGGEYFVGASGKGSGKVRMNFFVKVLRQIEQHDEPVLIFGTAFAFVHTLEHFRKKRLSRFQLPAGSRIMETGGYKGRSRDMDKAELYGALSDRLGIPETHIVNEYGMTELGTQFYDTTLMDGTTECRGKRVPHWVRVVIADPGTGEPVGAGDEGIIRIFDPVNRGSVAAIQTEDWGVLIEKAADGSAGRFEVLGRATGSQLRGCSLMMEEMIHGDCPSKTLPKKSTWETALPTSLSSEFSQTSDSDLDHLFNTFRKMREEVLLNYSTAEIIEVLARVGQEWRRRNVRTRNNASKELHRASGICEEAFHLGLRHLGEELTQETLTEIVRQEFGSLTGLDRALAEDSKGNVPGVTTYILGGAVPDPAILCILSALAIRSVCLVKPSSAMGSFPLQFIETLAEVDPRLAECVRVCTWDWQVDPGLARRLFQRCDCVCAFGADETLTYLKSQVGRGTKFIGHGDKFSVAVVFSGPETKKSPALLENRAERLALDISMYDNLGCLSPRIVFIEESGKGSVRKSTVGEQFANLLARKLAEIESAIPSVPPFSAAGLEAMLEQVPYRLRAEASSQTLKVFDGEKKTSSLVVLDRSRKANLNSLPFRSGRRVVVVKPFSDLKALVRTLRPFSGKVQGVGVGGTETQVESLAETLWSLGPTYFCSLGLMQFPPITWQTDGQPLLRKYLAQYRP